MRSRGCTPIQPCAATWGREAAARLSNTTPAAWLPGFSRNWRGLLLGEADPSVDGVQADLGPSAADLRVDVAARAIVVALAGQVEIARHAAVYGGDLHVRAGILGQGERDRSIHATHRNVPRRQLLEATLEAPVNRREIQIAAGLADLHASVHRRHLDVPGHAFHADAAVDGVDGIERRASWHRDGVLDCRAAMAVLGIPGADLDGVRPGFDDDLRIVERLLVGAVFDGVDLDLVAVPCRNMDGAVDVMDADTARGRQRVGLVEFLAHLVARVEHDKASRNRSRQSKPF